MAYCQLNKNKKNNNNNGGTTLIRTKTQRYHVFVLLLFCSITIIIDNNKVEAFSARLSRPWELQQLVVSSKSKRKRNNKRKYTYRRRIHFSVKELFSSSSENNNDEDNERSSNVNHNNNNNNEIDNDTMYQEEEEESSSYELTSQEEEESYSNDDNDCYDEDEINSVPINGDAHPPSSSSSFSSSSSSSVEDGSSQEGQDVFLTRATTMTTTTTTAVGMSTPRMDTTVIPTVKSCLPDLIQMTRPANFPGVILFHMLGIYLSIQAINTSSSSSSLLLLSFKSVIFRPSLILTLVALLLTSSTSMLVNDYYDFKLGSDSLKLTKPSQRVPLHVTKRFVSYLYAAALISLALLPGAPTRLSVAIGLMLTFWYTRHVKPRTWLKNIVCATLIALSPLTSGLATIAATTTTSSTSSSSIIPILYNLTPLYKVVIMLFLGILGREMTMDINDRNDDQLHGVRTVPVVYGTKFASTFALICSLLVSTCALSGPVRQIILSSSSSNNIITKSIIRRLGFASLGSILQLRRAYQVFQTEGKDPSIVNRAVDEGLLSVVLLLASYV